MPRIALLAGADRLVRAKNSGGVHAVGTGASERPLCRVYPPGEATDVHLDRENVKDGNECMNAGSNTILAAPMHNGDQEHE